MVSMTGVLEVPGTIGTASLRYRAGRIDRALWLEYLLGRSSWYALIVATWLWSSSRDLVPTSAPSKPSLVLEPDTLLDPDSVLDILDDTDERPIETAWCVFDVGCQLWRRVNW